MQRARLAGLLVSHRATATAATAKRRPSMGWPGQDDQVPNQTEIKRWV